LTEKRRKKVREGEKVAERKMHNMHLIRSLQARFKCGVKLTEKSARRTQKVTERKMGNMHLLEACKANM
jgi:hypothetical protein